VIFLRKDGITTMMTVSTLLVLDLFFYYWAVMSVEVFEVLNYNQINFTLIYFVLFLSVAVSFRSIESLDYSSTHRRWVSAISVTNQEIGILGLFLFGAIFATSDTAISRIFVGTFLVATWFVFVLMNRYLPDVFLRRVFSGENTVRLVLVGQASTAQRMHPWLKRVRSLGINVLGVIETRAAEDAGAAGGEAAEKEELASDELPILGSAPQLDALLRERRITHMMLIDHRQGDSWVSQVVRTAREAGVRFWIYNHWSQLLRQPLIVERDEQETYFTFHEEPLENPVNRGMKRAFDLAVAGFAMVTVFPVVALYALVMQRLYSPGPLFFKQRRYGRQQRPIFVYKFRTMHVRPQDEAKQATKGDPRIYRGAGLLRKSSLDELPQFINVLRSEMSVVGPRPHLDVHDDKFASIVEVYRTRQYVKPGLTGLAQVRGYRGEITDPSQIEQRVRLDIEYLSSWSLWLDLLIVLRTVGEVIRPSKGAV
jgi:exopolysaccharide biosynthesis polyprenyl glycosylphosphotransferase